MDNQIQSRSVLHVLTRLFGIIAIIFGLAGGLFKVMHWPGASFALLIAHHFFTLHLLLFGISCLNGKSGWHKLWIITTTFFSIILSIGILFKLLHWPGASVMLVFGAPLFLILGYLPLAFFERKSTANNLYTGNRLQHVFIFVFVLILMIYGRKPGRSILQSSVAMTSNTIRDNSDIKDEIAVYKTINTQSDVDAQAEAILENIDQLIKTIMITCGEVQTGNLKQDVQLIRGLDKYDEITRIMSGGAQEDAMETEQFNLLIQVAKFEDTWASITGNEPNRIDRPLTPSTYFESNANNNLFQFHYVPQIMAINQLVEIEQMVLNMYLDIYIVKSLKQQPSLEDDLESDELDTTIDEL